VTGVQDVTAVIQGIRSEGIAILFVEQNTSLSLARGVSDRVDVIDDGKLVHFSPAVDLEANTSLKHRLLAV
jgi:ABC-type branched-subunit amino acid transport system ATPase component